MDRIDVLALLELRCAIISHCNALKAVTELLEQDKKAAAVARLEGAVASLQATVRGQCAGQMMKCPQCGLDQAVVTWADEQRCQACGEPFIADDEEGA